MYEGFAFQFKSREKIEQRKLEKENAKPNGRCDKQENEIRTFFLNGSNANWKSNESLQLLYVVCPLVGMKNSLKAILHIGMKKDRRLKWQRVLHARAVTDASTPTIEVQT